MSTHTHTYTHTHTHTHLHLHKGGMVEELLQVLVGEIDAQLLKTVDLNVSEVLLSLLGPLIFFLHAYSCTHARTHTRTHTHTHTHLEELKAGDVQDADEGLALTQEAGQVLQRSVEHLNDKTQKEKMLCFFATALSSR